MKGRDTKDSSSSTTLLLDFFSRDDINWDAIVANKKNRLEFLEGFTATIAQLNARLDSEVKAEQEWWIAQRKNYASSHGDDAINLEALTIKDGESDFLEQMLQVNTALQEIKKTLDIAKKQMTAMPNFPEQSAQQSEPPANGINSENISRIQPTRRF